MTLPTFDERRSHCQLHGTDLARYQTERLNYLLAAILPTNAFYREKLADCRLPLTSLQDLAALPFTRKSELLGTSSDDLAANHTFSIDRYVRFHRTSGTRGRPMAVLDTADDWQWWLHGWQFVLDVAEITPADRVLLAFSFGPFLGFWSAFDAIVARGALALPTGGMGTMARLDLIKTSRASAVFCTPTYAMHLADVARANNVDLPSLGVRNIVVAGEAGGSIPATRSRIEQAWNARVIDHAGATEIGPWGFQAFQMNQPVGLHVNESQFITEFLSLESGAPAKEGELSEMVITSLGRVGCPVIRYRTGDLVRPRWKHGCDSRFVLLDGGVLGRADDMLVIRGVNVFPSSIEAIVRRFPEVDEFRMIACKEGAMDALTLEIEDRSNVLERVSQELQVRLGLKVDVKSVPCGSLPRTEAKAQRFLDRR